MAITKIRDKVRVKIIRGFQVRREFKEFWQEREELNVEKLIRCFEVQDVDILK